MVRDPSRVLHFYRRLRRWHKIGLSPSRPLGSVCCAQEGIAVHSRRWWATGAASALVTVAVLLGFTAARANVDINITSSNGCAWAGGSAISGNSGSGQTTDWLSDCLYSVGVRMDTLCDWSGCWGYDWTWQSGEYVYQSSGADCSLGCYTHAWHQITAPRVSGSQLIATSTN